MVSNFCPLPADAEYTPIKSLNIQSQPTQIQRAQVVFSKIAKKPLLHHAESWSPDATPSRTLVTDSAAATEYYSFSTLSRKNGSSSDYGTLPKDYDEKAVYYSLSSQSDYGSMRRGHKDYEFVGKSRPVQTCGCDKTESCSICYQAFQFPDENAYDLIKHDYRIDSTTQAHSNPQSLPLHSTGDERNNNIVRQTYYNKNIVSAGDVKSSTLQRMEKKGGATNAFASLERKAHHISSDGQKSMKGSGSFNLDSETAVGRRQVQPDKFEMSYHVPIEDRQRVADSRRAVSKQLSDFGPSGNSSAGHQAQSNGKSVKFDLRSGSYTSTESRSYRVPSTSSDGHDGTTAVKREWQKLRKMLRVVGAVRKSSKLNTKLGNTSEISSSELAPRSIKHHESETPDETEYLCECCKGAAMKCPGSFDRRVKAARSYESLLASGTRIPTVDLGEGNNQVSCNMSFAVVYDQSLFQYMTGISKCDVVKTPRETFAFQSIRWDPVFETFMPALTKPSAHRTLK